MRKFYMFFIALFVSGFASLASAQSYPPTGQDNAGYEVLDLVRNSNVGSTSAQTSHTDNPKRFCMGLPLSPKYGSTSYGETQRLFFNSGINFSNYTNYPCYNNLTWLKEQGYISNDTFILKVGQTLSPIPEKGTDVGGIRQDVANYWDGAWMPYSIYIDYDIDNSFSAGELVSAKDGDPGNDSYSTAASFRAGTTPGTYRYRVLTATNNTPQGTEWLVYNGGMVADAYIKLVRPTVRFSYNSNYVTVTPTTAAENLVCGEDYIFTVTTNNAKVQINSVTARIGDENVYQDVQLVSDNGTYTVPASQFQNDMVITINATKTSTFTAAQAAQGECYFLLKNRSFSSRYLKAGITPNKGATDRFTYEMPYLFTHTLTQNRSDKDIASYIWRLTPATTNGKYYMKGQGLALGAIPNGGQNKCVPLQESGAELTISSSGNYYTLTTGAGNKGYLHAINFGQSTPQDIHFPDNVEGDFVVSWESSAAPSQWTIEPIECFSVTIGAGGWSSFNYAFPIAFAENEVSNVYISTSENTGVVTLVPLTANEGLISVPSNTPIFVEGAAGTICTVELLTTEPTVDVSANTLRGTTLPQTATLTSGETAYVIATPSGKETALYRLGADVKIPLNKAYYVSRQQQTSKLGLNFGEVTEISNAVTAQPALKDEILYDLRGHRVVYPTRGIYVTGSGRKIFIK